MKKCFLIPLLLLFICCNVNEKPLFVNVGNMQVVSSDLNNIVITADAFFINQNDVGGSLESKNIDVIINDVTVAQMSSKEFDVPSRAEFTIPLTVQIPTEEIFKNNSNNVIGGILNSLITKKINVRYKGIITYRKFGFSYDYEVDKTEIITIDNK